MDYKSLTPWIFIVLMLLLAMMWASGSTILLWIGIVAVPLLIIFQVYIILKGKDESKDTFDDKWYDDR